MLPSKLIPGGKADVHQTREGMEITIKLPRNILMIGFLCFWLCGWAMGEIFVTAALISMAIKAKSIMDMGPGLFLIFWLCGWTFGGYFAITTVLRSAFGSDVINISSSEISINEKIGNWGKPKVYDVPSIRNFRIMENGDAPASFTPRGQRDQTGPVLAFDFQGNMVQFVKGLTLQEVEAILDVIWNNNYLEQDNFAKSVIKSKLGEEKDWDDQEDWEEGEDESKKTVGRKKADREASAQRTSEEKGKDGKSGESDDIYYADI